MQFAPRRPPRRFRVGREGEIEMKDCGAIRLEPDEQVTFTAEDGSEFDVARKDWGYYGTPSLNGRLPRYGLRPCLARSRRTGHHFLLIVQQGREAAFHAYLVQEAMEPVCWLDDDAVLDRLTACLEGGR